MFNLISRIIGFFKKEEEKVIHKELQPAPKDSYVSAPVPPSLSKASYAPPPMPRPPSYRNPNVDIRNPSRPITSSSVSRVNSSSDRNRYDSHDEDYALASAMVLNVFDSYTRNEPSCPPPSTHSHSSYSSSDHSPSYSSSHDSGSSYSSSDSGSSFSSDSGGGGGGGCD